MAYTDKVIDHFENPKNVGSFDKDADDVGTGLVGLTNGLLYSSSFELSELSLLLCWGISLLGLPLQ